MRTFPVGGATVAVIPDGRFFMPADFLTGPVDPGTGEVDKHGRACLPVQSFLVSGSRTVLIDAGLGPDPERDLASIAVQLGIDRGRMGLFGDSGLIRALAACGVNRDAVNAVCLTHLHADHVGWLALADGAPAFPNADILVPRADFDHYVGGDLPHLPRSARDLLRALADQGRVQLLDGETAVSREVTAVPAPGHTAGHTIYAIADRGERALLIGDAMYCPAQLSKLDVGARHDADSAAARRTRAMISEEARKSKTKVIGGHFAEGRPARLSAERVFTD
jgi:glyoxylase-like metal-dependent hydrolase (beta-lactamase superfamily II)